MKKAFLLFAFIVSMTTSAFATLTDGSNSPNWTLTATNNVTYDLYTMLAQGKTVYFEVGAAWELYSWQYFNSGALDSLYNQHGPSGTIDTTCYVFFIEADGATGASELGGAGNTQGNWLGAGVPYPIIDIPSSSVAVFNYNFATTGYPVVYKVGPNHAIYDAQQGDLSDLVSMLYPDAMPGGAIALSCSGTFSPWYWLTNNSVGTSFTSCMATYQIDGGAPHNYTWNGNLAAGQSIIVSLPAVTLAPGSHTLTVTTSAPNGGTDGTPGNDMGTYVFYVNTSPGATIPYSQAFASSSFPASYTNWILENPDGGSTWAWNGSGGGCLKRDFYNDASIGEWDDFMMEGLDLSTANTATLQFDVAYEERNAAAHDTLQVWVTTDCEATWTLVYQSTGSALATGPMNANPFVPTPAQWRTENADLSPFVGYSSVFIQFWTVNGHGNNLYVKNINISNPLGVASNSKPGEFSLYPNPAQDVATVAFNTEKKASVTMNVYNALGEIVYSTDQDQLAGGNHTVQIDTALMNNGVYLVEIRTGDTRGVTPMVVSH